PPPTGPSQSLARFIRPALDFSFPAVVVVVAAHVARNDCDLGDMLWLRGRAVYANDPMASGNCFRNVRLQRRNLCALLLSARTNPPSVLNGSDRNWGCP